VKKRRDEGEIQQHTVVGW